MEDAAAPGLASFTGIQYPWSQQVPVMLQLRASGGDRPITRCFVRPAGALLGHLMRECEEAMGVEGLTPFCGEGKLPDWISIAVASALAGGHAPLCLDVRPTATTITGPTRSLSSPDCSALFFSALKQAYALRYGSAVPIQSLPLATKAVIYQAVCEGAPDVLRGESAGILLPADTIASRVPVRVLVDRVAGGMLPLPRCSEGLFTLIQRPVPRDATLAQTLALHLSSNWREAGCSVALYGVPVAREWEHTPIEIIYQQLSHPDGFLYLVCRGSGPHAAG